MIDDQKQTDTTSQTDEAIDNREDGGDEAITQGGVMDLESQPAEVSGVSAEAMENGAQEATPSVDEALASGDLATLESLRQENEALKAQLEELNRKSEELKTQSMRIAADFDNFRKRTAKEKEDLEQQIKRTTISELLPVVDNFERARSQIKPQNDGEMAIHKSYQGVYKQLVDCLKRVGVAAMRPEGQEFDPNLHEAVLREPTHEFPEGTVIEQLQRGYFLGERVLRHAMVKVAAVPEDSNEELGENQSTPSE